MKMMKKKRIETTMTADVVVDAVRRFHFLMTLPRLIPSREKSAMSTPSPSQRHDGRGSVQTLFYRYDSPALVPLSLFTIGLGEVDACMIVGTLVLLFTVDTKASLELEEAARRRSWVMVCSLSYCVLLLDGARGKNEKRGASPKGKLLAGNYSNNSDVTWLSFQI